MCLMIVTSPETELTASDIEDYNAHNPNGFGAMWYENGTIQTERTLNLDMVGPMVRYLKGKEAALHWRFATHGTVSMSNTHPFVINPHLAMMHNGILPCESDGHESDTAVFAKKVLPNYLNGSVRIDESDVKPLNDWIGSGNRLVFLDDEGLFTIVGVEKGMKHKGAWYSNEYAWTVPGRSRFVSKYGDPRDWGEFDTTQWDEPPVFPRGVGSSTDDSSEIIVVDEVSPRDSRSVEMFRKDITDMELLSKDFSDLSELVEWYCGRADDPPTLAVLLWNVVREG